MKLVVLPMGKPTIADPACMVEGYAVHDDGTRTPVNIGLHDSVRDLMRRLDVTEVEYIR